MNPLFRLALRNLTSHFWRTVATVVGTGLGVAALLASLSIGANVTANLQLELQAAAGAADFLVTPGAGGRIIMPIDPLAADIAETFAPKHVFPVLSARLEPLRDDLGTPSSLLPGVDSGFQLQGRLLEQPDAFSSELTEGRLPVAGKREVAIGADFARHRGLTVGTVVEFQDGTATYEYTVTGLLDDKLGFASTNGGRVGVTHLTDLQDDLHFAGRASHLEVVLTDPTAAPEMLEAVQAFVGDEYNVTYPAGSGDFTSGMVRAMQAGLSILAATLLALGAFLAYNTFTAAVVERRRDFALLRTICLSQRDATRVTLYEAGLTGVIGAVVGIAFGVLLAWLLTAVNAVILEYDFQTLSVPWVNAIFAALAGVASTLLAAWLPAREAGKSSPLSLFTRLEIENERTTPWLLAGVLGAFGVFFAVYPWHGNITIAVAALALGLLFLSVTLFAPALVRGTTRVLLPLFARLFGRAAHLGAGFTQRNMARNSVALATVAIGVSLIIGVGSMIDSINGAIRNWVETTIVGDQYITSPLRFPADFAQQLEAIPGVHVASGVAMNIVRFRTDDIPRGRSVTLLMVDPERFHPTTGQGRFQYVRGQGDDQRGYDGMKAGEILVASSIAERYNIGVHDELELRTVDGFATFRVAGVVVDFTGGGESAVTSIELLPQFGAGEPDIFVTVLEPEADMRAVTSAVYEAFPELYLDITINQEYQRAVVEMSDRVFNTTRMLLVLAMIVAGIGVSNTLGMNLASRAHEIAVLRAIGVRKRMVLRMIFTEGLIITFAGGLVGVVIGVVLSGVITRGVVALTGFVLEPQISWGLAAIVFAVAAALGVVAALLPARRAANTPPVAAFTSWS